MTQAKVPDIGKSSQDIAGKLKQIRIKNLHRVIIGQLNINSLRNKFDLLKNTTGYFDIFLVSETKIDKSFPEAQFSIEGYSNIRLDRNNMEEV